MIGQVNNALCADWLYKKKNPTLLDSLIG